MGHDHGPPYVVPPHTKFTSIKGIPELEELERGLAAKGLKDPWIRNEIWRYDPGFGTRWKRAAKFFFRGFPLGLGLTVITVVATKALSSDDDGHHGH